MKHKLLNEIIIAYFQPFQHMTLKAFQQKLQENMVKYKENEQNS